MTRRPHSLRVFGEENGNPRGTARVLERGRQKLVFHLRRCSARGRIDDTWVSTVKEQSPTAVRRAGGQLIAGKAAPKRGINVVAERALGGIVFVAFGACPDCCQEND